MSFDVRIVDGVIVVRGEVDLATRGRLETLAQQTFEPGQPFVIDLAAVTFLDSTGLSALLRLRERAGGNVDSITLRGPNPMLAQTIELTSLGQTFHIEDA